MNAFEGYDDEMISSTDYGQYSSERDVVFKLRGCLGHASARFADTHGVRWKGSYPMAYETFKTLVNMHLSEREIHEMIDWFFGSKQLNPKYHTFGLLTKCVDDFELFKERHADKRPPGQDWYAYCKAIIYKRDRE